MIAGKARAAAAGLIIGEPVRIAPGTSPKNAIELLQQAMIDTR